MIALQFDRYGDPDVLTVGEAPQPQADVVALLRAHRIPERPMAGIITQRFPTPAPITRSFRAEAYTVITLAAAPIEQLTGQPAERILQQSHHQISVRRTGTLSPWPTTQLTVQLTFPGDHSGPLAAEAGRKWVDDRE